MATGWFFKRGNNEYGPYSWEEIVQYAREGRISGDGLVKSDQMSEWAGVTEVPGLLPVGSLAASPPPAAAPGGVAASAAGKKKKSPLKIIAIIGGSVIGLAGIVLIALLVIGLLLSREAEVTEVATAKGVSVDYLPVEPAEVFYVDTPEIFVTTSVKGATAGNLLTAHWYWESENYHINSFTLVLPAGDSRPHFSMTRPDNDWPVGAYRVDLELDETIVASARFRVQIEEGTIDYALEGEPGSYSGQLRAGVPHGLGWWSGTDGWNYDGAWEEGYPHGEGTLSGPDGHYEGEWIRGEPHGYGKMAAYGQFEYEGEFAAGSFNGNGTLYHTDGTVLSGTFVNGELIE